MGEHRRYRKSEGVWLCRSCQERWPCEVVSLRGKVKELLAKDKVGRLLERDHNALIEELESVRADVLALLDGLGPEAIVTVASVRRALAPGGVERSCPDCGVSGRHHDGRLYEKARDEKP